MGAPTEKYKTESGLDQGHECTDSQLRINFCVAKTIALALVVIGLVGLILALFTGSRVHLFSVEIDHMSDAERKALVDTYNSRFSNIMSAVNKTIEFAIQPLLAVVLLCLGAKWLTSKGEAGMLMEIAPTLAAAVVGFLICSGPTSVNVQVVPGERQLRMMTEDLQTVAIPFDNSSAWNASLSESAPNNSMLNTILRSQYVDADIQPTCTSYSNDVDMYFGYEIDLPQVTYSSPASTWLLDALPTAMEPKQTFELPVDGRESGGIIDFDFPAELTTARSLYIIALNELYGNLRSPLWGLNTSEVPVGGFFSFINESRQAAVDKWAPSVADDQDTTLGDLMAFAGDNFVPAAGMILQKLVSDAAGIVTDEVKAVYQLHELADSVTYTSLTLTIPAPLSRTGIMLARDNCAPDGCVILDDLDEIIAPFVKAAALCGSYLIPGYNESNCSLMIASLGTRTSGNALKFEMSSIFSYFGEEEAVITATELRTTYSLTIGVYNMTPENLSVAFSAECGDNLTNCFGVQLSTDALKQKNEVVLTNQLQYEEYSVTDTLISRWTPYFYEFMTWKKLVHIDKPLPILLPRNFDHVDMAARDYLSKMPPDACAAAVDAFLKNVVASHLYSEESLQMSYTAGLHFAFRTGVMHSISPSNGWAIDLLGNNYGFVTQVSIPTTNCILSIIGCCVLLALILLVAGMHRRSKSIIERNSSAPVLAEAMTNTDKFPRLLINLLVERRGIGGAQTRQVQLDQMEMAAAEFVEKKVSD